MSASIGVQCQGYSKPLQRAMVDFGADVSFAAASQKLKEHYGIDVPSSSIRARTLHHSQRCFSLKEEQPSSRDPSGVGVVILESDGTMVPLVETADSAFTGDRRKTRQVSWKEGITSLAYARGSVDPIYAGTLNGRDEAGFQMKEVALEAGLGKQTKIHALGDGAPWICEKIETHFGAQANYLIDFYHLCDYLGAACQAAFEDGSAALKKQKQTMKKGGAANVLEQFKSRQESESILNEKAPIRALVRYMKNRPGQFEYKTAIDQQLPIGSGKIESAHRSLIQKRLKLPGAWWKKQHADQMIQLRVARANGKWDGYWQQLQRA